ncbi:MAG: hypothetical protein ABI895_00905 [Deltaproteobacteria bacterium]
MIARVIPVLLWCALLGAACREPPPPAPPTDLRPGQRQSSLRGALTPVAPEPRTLVSPTGESAPVELDARLQPPDQPLQRLAFTAQRLAQLAGEQLLVRSVPDMRSLTRIEMPGARNVVAGVGGDLVAAGNAHVYRVARLDDDAEVLAPVPRLGPTTILPGADSSDHFWLLYEGIPTLPEFDLQESIVAPYISVLSWTQLTEFDGRAVSNPGDGSFVYTTPRGLRRVNAEGSAHDVSATGLGEQVWRLLPAGGGAVWAATPYHLQLLQVGSARASAAAGAQQRIELPQHAVALAKQGRDLAVLAVESLEEARARLRVELYRQGSDERRVLRFEDVVSAAPLDAGAPRTPEFAPEVALAPGQSWVAVFGFGLSVFDWRTGVRLFPRASSAASALSPTQNLAPRAR